MNPQGHESDPMAFMRPRGDPKNTPSPHAYFYQVFFREGGTLPAPGALARRRVLLRLGRRSRRSAMRAQARVAHCPPCRP